MKKLLLGTILLFSSFFFGQNLIEGLTYYPNPISCGKLYIKTTKNMCKDITITDVLSKLVLVDIVEEGKELLDISRLGEGVYLIRIEEDNKVVTRKLIVIKYDAKKENQQLIDMYFRRIENNLQKLKNLLK